MKKKINKARSTFMQDLSIRLLKTDAEIEVDNSEKWITYRIGDKELIFEFDEKGDQIQSIKVFKDVVQVVDKRQIF